MITAIVLTKNSENTLVKCINSLLFCSEIIIIDDYSSDTTLSILEKYKKKYKKLRIIRRNLNKDFSAQRNFGISKAKNSWILFIDSDEIVSPDLQKEISVAILNKDTHGYFLKRNDYFLGKKLKFGETAHNKFLRLAIKKKSKWERKVHELWKVKGTVKELKNPIIHNPDQDLKSFIDKINYYSDIVAQYRIEQGIEINFWQILFYPIAKFIKNYVIYLGFLDGTHGFVLAVLMSFHSYLDKSKQWLNKQKNP
jgi:glycosyltransferase involved in cell wall biosynthesis